MSELEPTRTYSNPTATDVLRRLLDERGVEWQAPTSFDGTARYDTVAGGYWFHEFNGKITIHGLDPEQAIAATLGATDAKPTQEESSGTCHDEGDPSDFCCSECGSSTRTNGLKLRRTQMQFTDEQQRFIDEHYQLLPKDADGVPIHVGDVMEWPTTGETFEVVGIGEGTLFYVEDGSECADWTGASTKRHHHAPTVEDVLREFAYGLGVPVADSYVAATAAKLRLAEGEDA